MQNEKGFSFRITKEAGGAASRVLASALLFLGLSACLWNGLGLSETGCRPLPLAAAGIVYSAAACRLPKRALAFQLAAAAALLIYTVNPILLATGTLVVSTVLARRRGLAANAAAFMLSLFVLRAYAADLTGAVSGLSGSNYPFALMQGYTLKLGPEGIARADGTILLMLFLTVAALGLMALMLYVSLGHRPLAGACVLIFAIGFAARMALSFSPTVVESGERTMLPLYGAMMLCALLCLRDCEKDGARHWPIGAAGAVAALCALCNVIGSFALAA